MRTRAISKISVNSQGGKDPQGGLRDFIKLEHTGKDHSRHGEMATLNKMSKWNLEDIEF